MYRSRIISVVSSCPDGYTEKTVDVSDEVFQARLENAGIYFKFKTNHAYQIIKYPTSLQCNS